MSDRRMAVVGSDQASVLDKVGGVWLERGTLDPGTLDSADDFGSSVSVSGDVVVVGAAGAEAAYVFRYGGIVWQMEQKLSAPDGPDGDAFGTSVGVDRGLIVVGAPEADPLGDQSGAAYVFERSGGPWVAVAKLSEGDEDDHFGTAVAASGGEIVVGASGAVSPEGAAIGYHFVGGDASWTAQPLVAPSSAPSDLMGATVAFDGDVVVLGAPGVDDGGPSTGAAHVFIR